MTGSHEDVLHVEPKLLWKWVGPLLPLGLAGFALSADAPSWFWLLVAYSCASAAGAWRSLIRIEAGVISRRGLLRWHREFVLGDLAEVTFQRRWGLPSFDPHLELTLRAHSGSVFSFQPRWWADADRLIRLVALATAGDTSDRPPPTVDRATWKRLTPYLP